MLLMYRVVITCAFTLEFLVSMCTGASAGTGVITQCTTVFSAVKSTDVFYDACRPITNFPCSAGTNLFADPAGCNTFYQCVHTNVLRCPCALGTGYDIVSNTCVANFFANCSCPTTTTTTTIKATTTAADLATESVTESAESTLANMGPQSTDDSPPSTKEKSTLAATIGTVAGTAVFLFIVIVVIALVVKHKQAQARKEKAYMNQEDPIYMTSPAYMVSPGYDSRISVSRDIYSTIDEDTATVIKESMYDNNTSGLHLKSAPSKQGPLPSLPTDKADDIPESWRPSAIEQMPNMAR